MKNIAASVRTRLLNLANQRGDNFEFILKQYVMQRLLYRLSCSDYQDNFLLKGALLFWVWHEHFHRPTLDIDLLGFGTNDVIDLLAIFQEICALEYEDGLIFDINTLHSKRIKEDMKYEGVRVTGQAYLEQAKIPFQVDIGYGDVVLPPAKKADIPTFLDFPKPNLSIYPVYTVIAEKFQAMVSLDLVNSRMKDFYDLWIIIGACQESCRIF